MLGFQECILDSAYCVIDERTFSGYLSKINLISDFSFVKIGLFPHENDVNIELVFNKYLLSS